MILTITLYSTLGRHHYVFITEKMVSGKGESKKLLITASQAVAVAVPGLDPRLWTLNMVSFSFYPTAVQGLAFALVVSCCNGSSAGGGHLPMANLRSNTAVFL